MIDPWAAALDAPEAAEAAVLAQNGAEPSVRCGVTHLGDGVYAVPATPWRAGEYQLVLHVEGDDSADENGGGGRRTRTIVSPIFRVTRCDDRSRYGTTPARDESACSSGGQSSST